MKQTAFYLFAILAIGFLLYLNFGSGKEKKGIPSVIVTDSAAKPSGPYSQAVARGNALFISGQIGIDPKTGEADTFSIVTETERVMENIRAILSAAGLKMKAVARSTIYVTDERNFRKVDSVYGSFFGSGPYPACDLVQVAALPGRMHVEISVMAVK